MKEPGRAVLQIFMMKYRFKSPIMDLSSGNNESHHNLSQGERKLAAVMFTDMVGYTALGQRDEPLSLALVEEQRKLLRPIFVRHNGREVKTIGDAFLVEFPSALDATMCAYDIQRATREFNFSLPQEKRVHLRIGVHLGDVLESQGDISGDAVNVASRIQHLAEDGGVCLTHQVYAQVHNKFELQLVSLGAKLLKNLSAPLEIYKMVMPWSDEKAVSQTQFDKSRIAILPFANMSPDPNDEYFADGMMEELISTTSSISGLTVIARTSVMGYKGTAKKVEEIGKELSVGTVLEGSVRKAGNRLRITVQLIEVRSQGHLWAQSYDRDLNDVFAVQTDIAKQVADALRVQMRPNEALQIEKKPTRSTEAYTLYLKGRYYWTERSKEGLLKAIEYFKRAIEKDSGYALAYAGIADCYLVLGDHRYLPYGEAYSRARDNASKAIEIEASSAEAHTSLAMMLSNEFEWQAAEREFRKALELNPNYATGHQWYGIFLWRTGRFEESLKEALSAKSLDPLSPMISSFCGIVYDAMEKYELAEEQHERALEIEPNFIPGLTNLRWAYLHEGKYDKAERVSLEILRLTNNSREQRAYQATILAFAGEKVRARMILDEVNDSDDDSYVANYPVMVTYLGLGETEKAIELIEEDYKTHAHWLPEIMFDPVFKNVRNDSRIVDILKKIGLEK
jgi:adenylate cyclase